MLVCVCEGECVCSNERPSNNNIYIIIIRDHKKKAFRVGVYVGKGVCAPGSIQNGTDETAVRVR